MDLFLNCRIIGDKSALKYVCEHIKSYLFQLAAPFVGKCHLFYYDVWRIKGMRKMDFLFVRLALKKKKTLIIYLTISVFGESR